MTELSNSCVKVELPGDVLYDSPCYLDTLTLADVREIGMSMQQQDEDRLYKVIDRRCSLNVEDLTLPDFKHILMWQRVNSYNSFPFKINWRCSSCGADNTYIFNKSTINSEDADEAYTREGILLDLPSLSKPIYYRVQRLRDEKDAQKMLSRLGIRNPTEEQLSDAILAQQLSDEDKELAEEAKYELVKQLTAEDAFVLQTVNREYDFGVKQEVTATCQSCQGEDKIRYGIDVLHFFPTTHDKESIRSRILSRPSSESTANGSGESGLRQTAVHEESARQGDGRDHQRGEEKPTTVTAKEIIGE